MAGEGDSNDRRVWDEALEPSQLRSLNAGLRRIEDIPGASPEVKAMAEKLLSGRVSLRDIADDPSGSAALVGGLAAQRREWESASDEERERLQHATDDDEEPTGPSAEDGPKRHSGGFSL